MHQLISKDYNLGQAGYLERFAGWSSLPPVEACTHPNLQALQACIHPKSTGSVVTVSGKNSELKSR